MATGQDAPKENIFLLPNIFNDTLNLLVEAHEYFQENGPDAQKDRDADYRALYACEMSRITMRLSSVMAWLMIQKAVFLGKLAQEDIDSTYHLDIKVLCLAESAEGRKYLPAYMNYLLDESRILYERINRLEESSRMAVTTLN